MVTYLLKKSYQRRDLKEIKFNDLWDSNGLFTTMWIFGKPPRILFFEKHIDNLIKSLKVYKLNETNVKRNIIKLINSNLKRNKKYNHLLRVAINNKTISVSLRKKVKIKRKFKLRLLNYKRIKPEYKNLKYKKLLKHLSKLDPSIADIGLCVNNRILESATSNILFVSNNKIYSPIDKFYKGTTFKSLEKKIGRIFKKDIFISALKTYDEIILIGSGKGVVSINNIDNFNWSRKSSKTYRYLLRIYQEAVTNCPRYYS